MTKNEVQVSKLAKFAPSLRGSFRLFSLVDPFPPSCVKDLSFQFIQILTTGAAQYTFGSSTQLNLNGAFQPTTGASHQPYGWDQMTPLYGRYKVTHVKVELEFTKIQDSDDIYVGSQLCNANTTGTLGASTVAVMSEKPMVSIKHLAGTGNQTAIIILDTPIWDIEGIPKAAYEADVVGGNYAALVTANPTQLPALFTAVAGSVAAGGSQVTLRTKVLYRTKFWDRVTELQS